jgi:hypothetical protein
MLIAYVSADEVNRDLATRMAATCGATLHLFSPKDTPPDSRFDAVLYDLESVPPGQREEIVTGLLYNASTRPVAAHAYELDANVAALRDNGVIFDRQLTPKLLRILCRSLRSAPIPVSSCEARREPAIMDLVGEITVSALGVACRHQ